MEGSNYRLWLHFDIGINSDYERLYQFLADNHAKECGHGLATFTRYWDGVSDLHESIKKDILDTGFNPLPKDRVYLLAPTVDADGGHKQRGTFIIGRGRTDAPWDVYSKNNSEVDE